MNKAEYKNLITFHPGYYLKELIEEMQITQDEFAKRLGTTGKNLSELLNGKTKLSDELAMNLSIMLGTSVDVWLNLQKTYDKKIIEIEYNKRMDKEAETIPLIDYTFFVVNKFTQVGITTKDKAIELLKFLGITSFDSLKRPNYLVKHRATINSTEEKHILNSNIWVQTALNVSGNIKTDVYNSKKLKDHLQEIRSMTLQMPVDFLPRLEAIFSSCGIAFVILPYLKNSQIYGAVKWVDKDRVILILNDRGKSADTFWFSLFHEIGHVLQEKLTMLIIDSKDTNLDEINKTLEDEADKFAQNILIPKEKYRNFINNGNYSRLAIIQFAIEIGIHPGIVVGRMQKEKYIEYKSLNNLKQKCTINSKY